MAGLTLEGEESGVKGGCGTSRSPAVLWTSPLDGNPGRRGLLVQSSSPVGIHHLLQLVVEDKLGVPGRECVLSGLAPTAGPVLWPPDTRPPEGPTSPGTWQGVPRVSPRGCYCPSWGRTALYSEVPSLL